MANTTTPYGVLIMLKKIFDPSYTTPELLAQMLDFMTDTSFEDRLPHSGHRRGLATVSVADRRSEHFKL
ncbi:MAG: hypothetical protein M3317_01070 [Actinomycetota bacterium]|nr:hypothetical protein [Actinomycetota bacterium]